MWKKRIVVTFFWNLKEKTGSSHAYLQRDTLSRLQKTKYFFAGISMYFEAFIVLVALMSLKNAWLSSSIFYLAGKGPNSSFRYTTYVAV